MNVNFSLSRILPASISIGVPAGSTGNFDEPPIVGR